MNMKNVLTAREMVRQIQTRHKLSQQEIAGIIDVNQVWVSRRSHAGGNKTYDAVLRLKALYDLLEKRNKRRTSPESL